MSITSTFCVAGALFAARLTAATLPAGFSESQVAPVSIPFPTAMEFAPDGRLFVCQQTGSLRVIKNGVLLSAPFVTVNVDSIGERGLLGVAFDPAFETNGYVYVYYTLNTSPRHNRISRFTASGDVAVSGSEAVLLELNDLSTATNHNGGAIHFGPDGRLYAGVGENANRANSQTLGNLLGKILRINTDGSAPTDNPFYLTASGVNRAIWALGLRNPFTFAFQPGGSRMLINDVGEISYEEINDGIAGSNYGWPNQEGPPADPSYRGPIFFYPHPAIGGPFTGCAITGGTFYNPAVRQFPASYVGSYFFSDLCGGWIRRLNLTNNTSSDFATGIAAPVDLKVGPDGALYYLAQGSGLVFRVVYSGTPPTNMNIGTFGSTHWLVDVNGNYTQDGIPTDLDRVFGSANNIPVVGDWNGSGTKKIGIFNPGSGIWLLDYNGNGVWDGPGVDRQVSWGSAGDIPVVGNWNGAGVADKIGTFNPSQGTWLLDYNGNFTWDAAGVDKLVAWGSPGDKPVVGDWNGSGTTKIGIFNPAQGVWLVDYNGNYAWEGAGVDRSVRWGSPGDTPVVGDWNGTGTSKIGVFNSTQAAWLLDYNGNYTWDGAATDKFLAWGSPGDTPVVGDWNGTGTTKIAIFNPSQGWWVIDYNGNYVWEGAVVDRFLKWGSPGDTPLVGKW